MSTLTRGFWQVPRKDIAEWTVAEGDFCCVHTDKKKAEATLARIRDLQAASVKWGFIRGYSSSWDTLGSGEHAPVSARQCMTGSTFNRIRSTVLKFGISTAEGCCEAAMALARLPLAFRARSLK